MSRYSHPYQQHCSDGCGCCEPLDLEQSGSISLPESEEDDGNQD